MRNGGISGSLCKSDKCHALDQRNRRQLLVVGDIISIVRASLKLTFDTFYIILGYHMAIHANVLKYLVFYINKN